MAPHTFTLSRDKRIKQARDFNRARAHGKRLAHGVLIVNWVPALTPVSPRLGVITGRKIGKAHVRNRARRLLRECFRLHQYQLLHPLDLILVARPSIAGKSFAHVQTDFLSALRRAKLIPSSL